MAKKTVKIPGDNSSKDASRIPTGMTIAEFLSQEGYVRGVDVTGREPFAKPTVLQVQGGKKYEVGKIIAQGGMGVIYEARDLNSKRVVALKVLPKDIPIPRHDLLRFIREGQLTSQLEHPNIVPLHEIGLDDSGRVFYTMKLVAGRTLTSILYAIRKNEAVTIAEYPLARLLNVFQKVCDAVAFAHSRGVVHRDLKPDNIMVGSFGEVQVMDWGLAKVLGAVRDEATEKDEEDLVDRPATWQDRERFKPGQTDTIPTDDFGETLKTVSGRVMGTPGFLAPEQILQEEDQPPDERADIYSLGAVLYSILTLHATVKGGEVKEMLRHIINGDIPSPASLNAVDEPDTGRVKETRAGSARKGGFPHCPDGWIPTALSDIAMKALAIDPDERYNSVQELQREIEDYQNGYIWHLVIDEDFSDPDILSRWELCSGQAEIGDGELRLFDGDPQVLVLKRDVPGDVRIEFECHVEGSYLNCVGCFMNSIRSDSCREIPWSGYEFEFGGYENTRNAVHRFNSQIWIEPDTPLAQGRTYQVMAERVGSKLRFVVNGREIASLTDPDPLSGGNRVAVGFVGWNTDTRYKHIRISTLGTPWKGDVLDLAERQIQKGRYDAARGLFEDTLESFPDAERRRRAESGLKVSRQRQALTQQLPTWTEALKKAWPGIDFKLQMVNDGLSLNVSEIPVGDLDPLRGLPLNVLYCAHCGVASLAPLKGMPLAALNCTGNPVTSLAPLKGMPLETLLCEDCPISDLEPLRGMKLKMLQMGLNKVADLEPLRGMPLTFLSCWSARIESLEPLRGMKLDTLNCAGNRIVGLEALAGMPLTSFHCGGNRIRYLEPLKGMTLTSLHCGENEIEDLSPVTGLPITILGCQNNRIADLTPLKDMPLIVLSCGNNPLRNLGPFVRRPPEVLYFDCDSISTGELKKMHAEWSKKPERSPLAHDAATLLALRENDVGELKKIAAEFRHHLYLFIPKFMRWSDARKFCEDLGGHLVTITSAEEDGFVASLFKTGCWFWMGLQVGDRGPEWVTGERFEYKNFISEMQEKSRGPKAFSRFWRGDHVSDPHNCFMIEWDES